MRNWRAPSRLAIGVALLLLATVMLAAGAVALQRMRSVAQTVESVYRDRVLPINQLRLIREGYRYHFTTANLDVLQGRLTPESAVAEINRIAAMRSAQWKAYLTTYLVEDERRLIAQAEPALRRADAALTRARALLLARDTEGLARFIGGEQPAAVTPVTEVLDRLIELQLQVAGSEAGRGHALYLQAVWILAGVALLAAASGGLLAWAMSARHARVQARARARSLLQARHFEALSRTNHAMVRATDPQRLFDQICQICADTGLGRLACILLVDGERLVRAAAAGPALPFLADAAAWDIANPRTRDSTAFLALSTGRPVVRQDYASDTHPSEWRDQAARHGIRGMAALPLRRGGQVVGVLNIYAGQTRMFSRRLLHLLDEMAGDLSFALDHIDKEAAMAASLERFRLLFHSTPLGTVIVNRADRHIIDVNDAMCRRYEATREELLGHTMPELGFGIIEEDRAALEVAMRRDGHVNNLECRVQLRDGRRSYSLVTGEPIVYDGQDCLVFMGLDITERHQAEEARREALAAELANRAKTEFLSRMSHELRTPLHAVIGFAQLLQSAAGSQLGEQQRGQVGHVLKAGWHLLELINDVLDVSRIETGQLQLVEEAVDLAPLLEDVARMSEPLARQHGVRLEAAATEALGVRADRIRLRQVLLNLVSNGIKYNRAGGTVRMALVADDGGVVLEVIDTGLGMSADQLAHLYEPFNRLGREHSGTEGTGIGLAITRQLVQLMGGRLEVQSEVGAGTTMRVTLQRAALAAPAAPASAPPAPSEAAPTGSVLYIEDNPVNAILVEQLLMRWPTVKLQSAADGESGIALARSAQPDLVLLDMQLPDMSGVQVLQALRADAATRGLAVVALSASAMPEEVVAARDAGASDYWTKPLDFELFLRNIRALLARGA